MRSGANIYNYFQKSKLTKLANLVELKRMLIFCLEDWVGPWGRAWVPPVFAAIHIPAISVRNWSKRVILVPIL